MRTMHIALFSDVHGRLRIVLRMIQNWQVAHGRFLDGTLIAGDLGCFPDPARRDKATRQWIERDPEEAGFAMWFTERKPEVEALFREAPGRGPYSAVKCPILFVPGNHEDYDHLHARAKRPPAAGAPTNTFPVDAYEAFHGIHNGQVVQLHGSDGAVLRVAGLWGIESTKPGKPYAICRSTVEHLMGAVKSFDLLLTHDAPFGVYPNMMGSPLVTKILHARQPLFHLFGHVHPANGQHEYGQEGLRTRCWILKDAGFGKNGDETLAGAMAVLEWDGTAGKVALVEDAWLKRMNLRSWQSVWAET